MNTRSKGNQNLIRYINNIDRLPRELREQRARLQGNQEDPIGMENQVDPPQPGANGNAPRQQRNIGAGDAPNTHAQRQGIVPPAIPNNNFEIKSSMINMIQNNKFHGLPMEDPLDHLDEFDRLCGLTKINGVSEDALKLRLFPFSLGDKAHQWEKALPQGSITSWDDCKKAFLAKFFSNSRTAKLRNEISGFAQKSSESFCEAWERFKNSAQKCPHHGFSQESLLSTLYRGVLPKFRMMLDTASNGNFLNKDVEDGWELVENLAQSDGNYSEDYDRTIRGSTESDDKTRKEMKALNEKLDKLLLVQQKQLNFVCEAEQVQVQDGEVEQSEEVCYMQNQGGYNRGYNNYRANPNLSYRNTNVANPQDQVYPQQPQQQQPSQQQKPFIPQPQHQPPPPGFPPLAPLPDVSGMFQQLMQGQAASTLDNAKRFALVQHSLHDINTKVDTLTSRVNTLESNHTSTSAVKATGQLPGKAIQNPKEFCNAVFSDHLIDDIPDDDMSNVEFCTFLFDTGVDSREFDGDVREQMSIKHHEIAIPVEVKATSSVSEDSNVQAGEDCFSKNHEKTEQTKPVLDIDHPASTKLVDAETSMDRDRPNWSIQGDRSRELSAADPEISMEKRSSFTLPPYKPVLPFPGRFKKRLIAEKQALFDERIKEIEARMPLTEVVKLIPESQMFLKDLIMERIKATQGEKLDGEECSALMSEEDATPEKLDDPGSFILPCTLGRLTYSSLCDLGSSVSLMPLSVAERLGYKEFSPTKISLILADRSVKKPHGLLEDLPVKVGNVIIPTDFVVLDMDGLPKDPLILGRPFLATAGAVIDVKRGKIELNLGKGLKMTFDVRNIGKKPTIEGQTFYIEEIADLVEKPLERSSAKDHPIHTCNAILIREGDAVWEEEESDEDEHSEDDFSDSYGILTSNLARSRARKREQLAAEKTTAASNSTIGIDLPVKTLPPAPDEYSELQALKKKSEWQEETIRELTSSVKELTCLVKGMKAQVEQLQGQPSGSTVRDGSGFTVNGQKFKVVIDDATPERFSKPLPHPPEA